MGNFKDQLHILNINDKEDGIKIKRQSPAPDIDQSNITAFKNLLSKKETDALSTIKARIEKNDSQKLVLEMIETQIYTNLVGKMQQNIDKLDAKIDDDSPIKILSNLPSIDLNQQNLLKFIPISSLKNQNYSAHDNKRGSLCSIGFQPFNMPLSQSKFNSNANNETNNSNMGMNNIGNFLLGQDKPGISINPSDPINLNFSNIKIGEYKKSQVLYIRNLEHKDIKINMLYNIFSNFGNILKIILIRSKAAALIEFENCYYSAISKDYLNNIVFMGKTLKVKIYK